MGLLSAALMAAPLCAVALIVLPTVGLIWLVIAARFAVRYEDTEPVDAVADSLYWSAQDRP